MKRRLLKWLLWRAPWNPVLFFIARPAGWIAGARVRFMFGDQPDIPAKAPNGAYEFVYPATERPSSSQLGAGG